MTKPMRARSESLKSMTASTYRGTTDLPTTETSTRRSTVLWVDIGPKDAPLPEGFEDIDDVVAQSESDSRRAPYLEKARRDLAEREPDRIKGLAALRLRKGWSQKKLAVEVGTGQPHIARLEIGHEDILMETARRLAAALGVSIVDIDAALLAREQKR
jgi:ribosome-binding protein aMBF1 (putative translation factor)